MSRYCKRIDGTRTLGLLRLFELKRKLSFSRIYPSIMICLAIFYLTTGALSAEDELSLFNPAGKATAYITNDLTIYLWTGETVAYLSEDDEGFHVYGFNGKHLGWFVGGAVYDHNGKAVGAVAEVFRTPVDPVPFKDFRDYKPFKDYKESAPARPKLRNVWSNIPFKHFLMKGASD